MEAEFLKQCLVMEIKKHFEGCLLTTVSVIIVLYISLPLNVTCQWV